MGSSKYSHLLQPAKIGNVVLKNRMISSPSRPFFTQGAENYPNDGYIAHFEKKARNGAAIVTVSGAGGERIEPRHGLQFDIFDGHAQHFLSQLTETCHFYGTKVNMALYPIADPKWDMSTGVDSIFVEGDGSTIVQGTEIPEEEINKITEHMALQAKVLKEDCGFDGVFLHMCYHATLLARSLSPTTNKRTDKFGGSFENRCRWPLMVCEAIKKACGKDFIIEVCITGDDMIGPEGWTLDDTVKFAKMGVGKFDLLQLRDPDIDPNHPTNYNPQATPWLFMCEYVKKALVNDGCDMPIVAISGFTHPEYGEKAIAEGKCDFVAMARSFISNPEWGKLVEEGRGEDIVPCLRCNKCHKSSFKDPWASVCSVNPQYGLEHKIERMMIPAGEPRNIAVIGGGPAGMRFAIYAADNGHNITIYEKDDKLGGLIRCADNVKFKWTLKAFKEYLIRQCEKRANITIKLNTEATPEMIAAGNYDYVIAAVGSEPIMLNLPGSENANIVSALDVYNGVVKVNTDTAVVIGGGEIGVETAMLLAQQGVKATVIEMRDKIAADSTPVHFYSMFMKAFRDETNASAITKAICTKVSDQGVFYKDAEGNEQFVQGETVVIAAGMKSKSELAMGFAVPGVKFRMIGDCEKVGNVQKLTRASYGAANTIE